MKMNKIQKLKYIIDNSHNIVFFTGAGISVPSGIPDFRSESGLYKNNLHAEEIISHSYFIHNPKSFYEFYKDKMIYKDAKPNIAHKWIANLEKLGKSTGVITQNIDNLHYDAGSENVIELHGSIMRNYCMDCHKFYSLNKILSDDLPRCECQGLIKPDVVLYEEALDEDNINKAINMIYNADCLIIIGTSLTVYPAASFIRYFRGKYLVTINKTELNNISSVLNKDDLAIVDDVCQVIKELEKL